MKELVIKDGTAAALAEMEAFAARKCGRCGEDASKHLHLFGSQEYLCPTVGRFVELSDDSVCMLPCNRCGGPHPFDTSVPSVRWNSVIRASGYPEYLCLTCIVRAFALAGESFTATLWGEFFNGTAIDVIVNGQAAIDAEKIQQENNELRLRIRELEARASSSATREPAHND